MCKFLISSLFRFLYYSYSWGPLSLLQDGYRVFAGGKVRPGSAADHSPPSSAAVMEEQSYNFTHPLGHTGPVTGSLYLFFITYITSQISCLSIRLITDNKNNNHNATFRTIPKKLRILLVVISVIINVLILWVTQQHE